MAEEFDKERREFLKQSVLSVGKTVYEYYEQQKDAPSAEVVPAASPVKVRVDWLRPPGAVEEELFLDRCTKCGDCLPACPYGSIKKDQANGYPVLFANESACHLCDDFPCIAACETEALLPVEDRTEVRMGMAVVSRTDCMGDQGCRFCLAKCPVGALSVDFIDAYPVVDHEKCVGCGICEQVCSGVNDRIAIKAISGRFAATKSP
ncbi:MAG: 4Fe-4S dicluster domain-containing protein [Nitrospirales bacterium]|nr:4Fe-4S dicluster domain-containing protein [Nitrospirales bacterium]